MNSLVTFGTFTMLLCNNHLYQVPEHFDHLRAKTLFILPSPQLMTTTVSVNLLILDSLC